MSLVNLFEKLKGGSGSGFFNHGGRPGKHGGSAPKGGGGGGSSSKPDKGEFKKSGNTSYRMSDSGMEVKNRNGTFKFDTGDSITVLTGNNVAVQGRVVGFDDSGKVKISEPGGDESIHRVNRIVGAD